MGSTWQEIGRRYSPILHWAFYRSFAPQPRSRYNDDFSPVNGREAKKCRKNRNLTDIHVDINRRSLDLTVVHNAAGGTNVSVLGANVFDPGKGAGYLPAAGRKSHMSFNTFGQLFRVTTFGESHGPAIGCVVDGCPPRVALSEVEIQHHLDRRRPGQSRFTTQRREPDIVRILSGVMRDPDSGEQVTTGAPIALLIDNVDQRSKDYSEIKDVYRPGHADYTYDVKYGLRDYRGGGRSSARETATRVAAGAIARKLVPGLMVRGALIQIGPHKIDRANWDFAQVEENPFFSPDAGSVGVFSEFLDGIRKSGSSAGAVIEVIAEGVPAGLGAPVYAKLDADLAAALMGINAVKGVEIGDGFAAAVLSGEENADEIRVGNDAKPRFLSNHAGGILG